MQTIDLVRDALGRVQELVPAVLDGLTGDDLPPQRADRHRWTPPVTVGVQLVSVMVETAQHVGQAGYLRGLRERITDASSEWAGTA